LPISVTVVVEGKAMKKIAVVFFLGFALWAFGHPGSVMDIPSIHVGATPWMLNLGSFLMAVAVLAALIRITCRRRYLRPIRVRQFNRAEMAVRMKAAGGFLSFNC